MVLSFFKSGDELYDRGVDCVKRNDMGNARKNFEKTIAKDKADPRSKHLASLQIALVDVCTSRGSKGTLEAAADAFDRTSEEGMEFGITEIDCKEFANECSLRCKYLTAIGMTDSKDKADALRSLAINYQTTIGPKTFKLDELIKDGKGYTGISQAIALNAMSYEVLSRIEVQSDPKKAAEYLQNAYNLRKQAGEDGGEDMNLIRSYSKSVRCWICGRNSTGEGIHFGSMSSHLSPFMQKTGDDVLISMSDDRQSIFVCTPCFTSISRRADAIAKDYHNASVRLIREVESNLNYRINALESRVNNLNFNR